MRKTEDHMRMWRPSGGYAPTITPRRDHPCIIQTDRRSDPRQVAADVADAVAVGREAIVLGHVDGVRTMICRALPQPSGVFLIAPSPRGTGPRPHIGAAMAEAGRLVAAEYAPHA